MLWQHHYKDESDNPIDIFRLPEAYFTYEKIKLLKVGDIIDNENEDWDNAYSAIVLGCLKGFIILDRLNKYDLYQTTASIKINKGYKFHISIYDRGEEDNNLNNAWNIVERFLRKHRVKMAKVIRQ